MTKIPVADVLARARDGLKIPVRYRLGKGGMNPAAASPADREGYCDCSGFFAWCHGVSRYTDHPRYREHYGQWLYTDAIFRDALDPQFGAFVRSDGPVMGCGIVFPKRRGLVAGHIGIVSGLDPLRVIHCSSVRGQAVRETDSSIFEKHAAILVLFDLVDYAESSGR